jgi:hypothetical protein
MTMKDYLLTAKHIKREMELVYGSGEDKLLMEEESLTFLKSVETEGLVVCIQ